MFLTESSSVIEDVINRLVLAPISTTHMETATRIAEHCLGIKGIDLRHQFMEPRSFSVGEFCPKYVLGNDRPKTLRRKNVYILMLPGPYKSPEELVERAQMAAFTAKEHYADKVVLLATDLPHNRQDRGWEEDEKALGEPTTVRFHARQFKAAGIDEVITTHEHSPRIPGFYALEYGLIPPEFIVSEAKGFTPAQLRVPHHIDVKDSLIQELGRKVFKSISPHAFVADYILYHSSLAGTGFLKDDGAKTVLKAMDKGNIKFINELYGALFLRNISIIYCNKARKAKNDPNAVEIDVATVSETFDTLEGKIEITADDGGDTGGTQRKAAEWSDRGNTCAVTGKAYGRPADRLIYFTHAWLGGESHQAVQEMLFKNVRAREFVTTNTRPYINESQYYRFKTVSTVLRFADLWSDAIIANELGQDLGVRYSGFSSKEEQHEFLKPLYALKRHSPHFMVDENIGERRKVKFYVRS